MKRSWLKWLPAGVAIVAVGVLAIPLQAGAAVILPAKTPEQLLVMVQQSTVRAFSGTVEQTSDLGLPQLPTTGPGSNADATSILELLTGSHTARVYVDGPSNERVQVMDSLAERDVVRHGNDVWLYNSKDKTATHLTLPAKTETGGASRAPGEVQTPAQLAERLLAGIDPSTKVSVDQNVSVAGRTAYDLVLTPRASDTLVGSVSIAVDSATGMPLRVDVYAHGQNTPALQVAFSTLTLEKPAASLFTFTPPAGATVKQQSVKQPTLKKPDANGTHASATKPQHLVSGTGWSSILQLPAGTVSSSLFSSPTLSQATRAVPGGRVLSTTLVNVLLENDGRVFVGAVPLALLQAAAAGQ
ncbi:MAG: sigma-E factor regulatory protein RseB domain-containing protein [Lacisediminihabitans sp.]